MRSWTLGLPYSYDTIQPQNATQDWNTSDVTSDNLIDVSDISAIRSWTLGLSVTVDDKPWALSNENLPASIAVNTPTAFQINLASTIGTQFGRAGLPVIANIDAANSTATGSLGGRTCTPVVGSRDQAASSGAQCAISVTVTDWTGASGPTKGLTENGTYGFSVTGTTPGNLRIIFSISGNPPGLDIPAITAGFNVVITPYNPPPTWISAPTNITGVSIGSLTNRMNGIATDSPASTVTCSSNGTSCTFPVTAGGSGDPLAFCSVSFTSNLTVQTCSLRIIVTDSGFPAATLGSTISITTVNNPPTFTTIGGTTAREGVAYAYTPALTDTGDGESLKCVIGVGDTCGGTLPADTPGARPHNCTTYTFTPGSGVQSCVISIRGVDNGVPAESTTQTTTVTINRNPTWGTQPANINITALSVYSANNGIMSDVDTPAQMLTCSTSATTCGFPITYNAGGVGQWPCGINFTAPIGSGSCTLTLLATDEGVPAANMASNQITITRTGPNVAPAFSSTPLAYAMHGMMYTYNITATDVNDGQTIAITKAGSDTCGGELNGTCTAVTPLSGCTYTFTPGTTGQTCVVGVTATDNGSPVLSSTQNTPVTVISAWTWMSGSNGYLQYGVYGDLGVPDPANVPGARHLTVSRIDVFGHFWLFGGYGRAASGSTGWLNDLWRWDGANWTWMSGSNSTNQNGVYGTKGVPDTANIPGARREAVSWKLTGNFWLFGGRGYPASGGSDDLNDLWVWDGANWTWMSGSDSANQNGVYGTKGLPDSANIPGARYGSVSWKDASGNFWLFGGEGYPASGSAGYLNDLWVWDGTNWTWVSGSDAKGQLGVYGTKGVPAEANIPGARSGAVSWIDVTGNLWFFGGYVYNSYADKGNFNDLWKWDGSYWTWMSGSSGKNSNGSYGTKGVPAPTNSPSARSWAVTWIDAAGNFWLFGGDGLDRIDRKGALGDLWRWDGTNWTWVGGGQELGQYGVYGMKGVPDLANFPGGRFGAVSGVDSNESVWLFGGFGYAASGTWSYLNDFWRYTP